jgi:hypothetical protein
LTALYRVLKLGNVARYSAFLGQRVEVHYRAGELILPATGTLVADSGRSIFLEEKSVQRGTVKTFRWEIPYQCIGRLEGSPASTDSADASDSTKTSGARRPSLDPLHNSPKQA